MMNTEQRFSVRTFILLVILLALLLFAVDPYGTVKAKYYFSNFQNPVGYHNDLGNYFQNDGRYKWALDEYQKTLKLDPVNVIALNNIGFIYNEFDYYKEAIPLFEKALKADPKNTVALGNLAFACDRSGNKEKALRLYRKVLRLDPRRADVRERIKELERKGK